MLDPLSAKPGPAVKWLFADCQKLSRSHNLAYREPRGTRNTPLKDGVVGEKSWLLDQLGTVERLPSLLLSTYYVLNTELHTIYSLLLFWKFYYRTNMFLVKPNHKEVESENSPPTMHTLFYLITLILHKVGSIISILHMRQLKLRKGE